MSDNSAIEWTDITWNPTTGCDRISAGCDNCYALTMARRLKAMGSSKYQADGDPRTSGPGFGLSLHYDSLRLPYAWKAPQKVFVNSMSDLFHARVPLSFVRDVFAVIADTPQHTYQVLTKRASRLPRIADKLDWPPNLWLGVSVENASEAPRIDHLLAVPAAVRFLSCEPLLGPFDIGIGDPHKGHENDDVNGFPHPRICLTCSDPDGWDEVEYFRRDKPDPCGLGWVIIGGESGPGARPMDIRWARMLVRECQSAGVAVFVKQLGSILGRRYGAGAKGGDWEAWPEDLRIREFPVAADLAGAE